MHWSWDLELKCPSGLTRQTKN